MELGNISEIEKATEYSKRETFRVGMALFFIVGVMILAAQAPVIVTVKVR